MWCLFWVLICTSMVTWRLEDSLGVSLSSLFETRTLVCRSTRAVVWVLRIWAQVLILAWHKVLYLLSHPVFTSFPSNILSVAECSLCFHFLSCCPPSTVELEWNPLPYRCLPLSYLQLLFKSFPHFTNMSAVYRMDFILPFSYMYMMLILTSLWSLPALHPVHFYFHVFIYIVYCVYMHVVVWVL